MRSYSLGRVQDAGIYDAHMDNKIRPLILEFWVSLFGCFVGVLIVRDLLFEVCIRTPVFFGKFYLAWLGSCQPFIGGL